MLEEIERILRLINKRPNERFEPHPGDLQDEFYTSWFDGGAMTDNTGQTNFRFTDGSKAVMHVLGYLYITIKLADGTEFMIIEESPKAGRELSRIGRELELLHSQTDSAAKTVEIPKTRFTQIHSDDPNRPASTEYGQQFEFCTRCGYQVAAYAPNTDSPGTAASSSDPVGVSPYWCAHCQKFWSPFSLTDTSVMCPGCQVLKPFNAAFCGHCGFGQTSRN